VPDPIVCQRSPIDQHHARSTTLAARPISIAAETPDEVIDRGVRPPARIGQSRRSPQPAQTVAQPFDQTMSRRATSTGPVTMSCRIRLNDHAGRDRSLPTAATNRFPTTPPMPPQRADIAGVEPVLAKFLRRQRKPPPRFPRDHATPVITGEPIGEDLPPPVRAARFSRRGRFERRQLFGPKLVKTALAGPNRRRELRRPPIDASHRSASDCARRPPPDRGRRYSKVSTREETRIPPQSIAGLWDDHSTP